MVEPDPINPLAFLTKEAVNVVVVPAQIGFAENETEAVDPNKGSSL
jgi:hypothetical protein